MSKPHIRIHVTKTALESADACDSCMFIAGRFCKVESIVGRELDCLPNLHYELISGNINDLKKEEE